MNQRAQSRVPPPDDVNLDRPVNQKALNKLLAMEVRGVVVVVVVMLKVVVAGWGGVGRRGLGERRAGSGECSWQRREGSRERREKRVHIFFRAPYFGGDLAWL